MGEPFQDLLISIPHTFSCSSLVKFTYIERKEKKVNASSLKKKKKRAFSSVALREPSFENLL